MLNNRWRWLFTLGGILGGVLSTSIRGGRGQGGSSICRCPKCGYTMTHVKGVPCSATECPRCSTPMRGENC